MQGLLRPKLRTGTINHYFCAFYRPKYVTGPIPILVMRKQTPSLNVWNIQSIFQRHGYLKKVTFGNIFAIGLPYFPPTNLQKCEKKYSVLRTGYPEIEHWADPKTAPRPCISDCFKNKRQTLIPSFLLLLSLVRSLYILTCILSILFFNITMFIQSYPNSSISFLSLLQLLQQSLILLTYSMCLLNLNN